MSFSFLSGRTFTDALAGLAFTSIVTCSVFRICQTKRSKPHSMDRPSTAAKHDPPHRTTSSRNAGRLDGS